MTKKQNIHHTSIIDPKAKIASNVQIGPYCIIGENVEIGEGTILKSHICIEGKVKIGKNNIIYPFAVIGTQPQDLKFKGENSIIEIGNNNQIREHATIHPGTQEGIMKTLIGDNCLFMVGSHVAHDCIVHNNVILANNATLAGHVEVFENSIIGGLSAIHQFVKIGRNAIIGGMSGVEKNVIPHSVVKGKRASLAGINLIGLKRKNFSRIEIKELQIFYKELFEGNENLRENLKNLRQNYASAKLPKDIIEFFDNNEFSKICLPNHN
jgi:UDP-N-acetylglucosamine acyltransferase